MSVRELKLMAVLAHPDDESLGVGGTLARYADEGVATYVVSATRGERGRFGDAVERPAPEVIGKVREAELRAAAKELKVKEVTFLDYLDADLDKAVPAEAIAKIVARIRDVRPDVVLTFDPNGSYGHPDHIAICQFTTAACVCAADTGYTGYETITMSESVHRVSKLYYIAWTPDKMQAYREAFREIVIMVDGKPRGAAPWPDWAVTTVIDTEKYWPTVWRAICFHKTQLTIYDKLAHLSEESHRRLWGTQQYYRAFSTVNGGRVPETDLFEGLR